MIDLSRETAIAAIEAFYRAATAKEDVWLAQMAFSNGAELARLLLEHLQDTVRLMALREGSPIQSTHFEIEWETHSEDRERAR